MNNLQCPFCGEIHDWKTQNGQVVTVFCEAVPPDIDLSNFVAPFFTPTDEVDLSDNPRVAYALQLMEINPKAAQRYAESLSDEEYQSLIAEIKDLLAQDCEPVKRLSEKYREMKGEETDKSERQKEIHNNQGGYCYGRRCGCISL